ncbi:MAG: hypothetical protein KJ955_02665, partial [Nanoarchaeota archaeon]|nr:hypothetical protein [Nanoarchaeota archaeon]
VPGKEKETIELIDFLVGKVHFLNLNELEISDTNVNKLYEHGFKAKDNVSYGVKGSEKMALRLLDYCAKNNFLDVHYCTVALKDTVQLPTRIARRAKHVKKGYDILTADNTFIRGAVYVASPLLIREIRLMNPEKKKMFIAKLLQISRKIAKKFDVLTDVDEVKLRILLSKKDLLNIRKDLKAHGFYTAVVEDLPTYDEFEIESEEV